MVTIKKGSKTMKRFRLLPLLALFPFIISACATTAQQGCMDEVKQRYPTYTKDERLALFYGAKGTGCVQEWFLEVEKDKDGKPGTPKVAYHKIKLDKLLAVEKKQLADFESILDTNPQNERTYKLLDEMGVRSYFEDMERAGKFRWTRLQLNFNHNEFRKLLGEIDASKEAEDRRLSYTAQIFLPNWDPSQKTPFVAKYVEEAKRNGKLVFVGMTSVFDYELLGKKEPDPEVPWDPNRFIWKEKAEGLELRLYKVMNTDRPRDKQPHYLEATRLTHRFDKDGQIVDAQRESKPALRVFASPSDTLDIVVLDTDREGDLGFGFPDIIQKLFSSVASGKDLYLQHQPLLAQLFVEKLADKRKPLPKPQPQKLEVAQAGTPVDPWEKAPGPQGWSVPHEYKSEKRDNYKVEIVFVPRKPGEDSSVRQIKVIAKVYHAAASEGESSKGEVAEYHRPLAEFAEKNILEAKVDWSNKKKITIEREGKPGISGIVNPGKNAFTEEKPVAIDFTDGETRWRIVDRDKSGVYMYRMEISRSSSVEGENNSE